MLMMEDQSAALYFALLLSHKKQASQYGFYNILGLLSFVYAKPTSHPTPMNHFPSATILAVIFGYAVSNVYGHGHLTSPRSRNYYAKEEGKWWPADGTTPKPESCSNCKYVFHVHSTQCLCASAYLCNKANLLLHVLYWCRRDASLRRNKSACKIQSEYAYCCCMRAGNTHFILINVVVLHFTSARRVQ